MKDLKTLLRDIERDLLANLLVSLKNGKLSQLEAKTIAGDFVDKPYNSHDELFKKLYLMSDSSKEARRVFVKFAPEYFQEKDLKELSLLRKNFSDVLKGDELYGK